MYVELTPEDTVRDLRNLLISILPDFEFPRQNLMDYIISQEIKDKEDVLDTDFVIGFVEDEGESEEENEIKQIIVETSKFNCDLTSEEINILSILIMGAWLQRQITSIENTRMKYSGSDFKFTSQANHLSKLLTLQTECRRQSHHFQRLYKRRKLNADGVYESNWSCLRYDKFE